MKTLNDKISITYNAPASTVDKYVEYYITETNREHAIFIGQVFVPKSTARQEIEIILNDILKSEVYKYNILDNWQSSSNFAPIKQYSVTVGNFTTNTPNIYLGYKYPFKNYSLDIMKTIDDAADNPQHLAMMLQGASYDIDDVASQSYQLYPRYPFIATDKLNVAQLFNMGDSYSDMHLSLEQNENMTLLGGFEAENYVQAISMSLNLLKNKAYKKNLVLSSDNYTKTVITGEKLWLVTCQGQNIYNTYELGQFASMIGYSSWYNENLYIQEPNVETIYYAVQTNDPEHDIQDAWEASGAEYTGAWLRFEEVTAILKAVGMCRSTLRMKRLTQEQLDKFLEFVISYFVDSTPEQIIADNRIVVGVPILFDTMSFNASYIVPNQAIEQVRKLYDKFALHTYNGMKFTDFFYTNSIDTDTRNGLLNTYSEKEVEIPIKIAEFDECPAKFYLQWYDRFGGVQCQPFDGKSTKKISYLTTNISNRYSEVRPAALTDTRTFELNTKWINEDKYPLYESIFVSPELKLYDTENDLTYRVIVTDKEFLEKTLANQKKAFNMSIKLEINTKENIIY